MPGRRIGMVCVPAWGIDDVSDGRDDVGRMRSNQVSAVDDARSTRHFERSAASRYYSHSLRCQVLVCSTFMNNIRELLTYSCVEAFFAAYSTSDVA